MKVELVGSCVFCGKQHSVIVEDYELEKYKAGALAQNAFPPAKYSATDREFIISGMCPKCQDSIFGCEEDFEDE